MCDPLCHRLARMKLDFGFSPPFTKGSSNFSVAPCRGASLQHQGASEETDVAVAPKSNCRSLMMPCPALKNAPQKLKRGDARECDVVPASESTEERSIRRSPKNCVQNFTFLCPRCPSTESVHDRLHSPTKD
ncbi:hypothetical protein AB1Y20_000797 [Prymnesium parvum]|uniref:Uncharacterized protein n=1 Tax=Prymnesium parvum TaxID=97485 RepID=A0AB34K6A4_PRYPA